MNAPELAALREAAVAVDAAADALAAAVAAYDALALAAAKGMRKDGRSVPAVPAITTPRHVMQMRIASDLLLSKVLDLPLTRPAVCLANLLPQPVRQSEAVQVEPRHNVVPPRPAKSVEPARDGANPGPSSELRDGDMVVDDHIIDAAGRKVGRFLDGALIYFGTVREPAPTLREFDPDRQPRREGFVVDEAAEARFFARGRYVTQPNAAYRKGA